MSIPTKATGSGWSGVYGVGINNVGSYQVSGMPWTQAGIVVPAAQADVAKGAAITTAPIKIEFPYVTKFVTVRHDPTGHSFGTGPNNGIRVGFSDAGTVAVEDKYYFELTGSTLFPQHSQITLDIKVREVYLISCDGKAKGATVIAGLTNISTSRLSGSKGFNYSGSTGVG